MGCTSCGNRFAPTNPCNDCNKTIDSCDDAIQVAWVPNTACTLGITFRGVTSTLALLEGIKNCETDTRMYIDPATGCIHYNSERFVNGFPGAVDQVICPDEIAKHVNLCDLADVDDTACSPDNCSFLIYRKNTDCKEGCKGVNDKWQPWTPSKNKADGATSMMGINENGCPVVVDQPKTDEMIYRTIARTSTVTEMPYYGQTDFEIRLDSVEGNDGAMEAPDDMVVSVDWCSDYSGSVDANRTITVTVGENTDTFDEDYIRDMARHFQNDGRDWAMPGHFELIVHKGHHLKFHAQGVAADDDLPHFRIHQINVVWKRINAYREWRK